MHEAAIPRWLWSPVVGSAILTCALIGICASADGCNLLTTIPHLVGIVFAIVARKRLSLGLIALVGSVLMAVISQAAAADAKDNRQGDWKLDNAVGSMLFCLLNFGAVMVVGFAILLVSDWYEPASAKVQ